MNRKSVSKAAVFMAAGMVSACTSTDGPYRQGPWGHASTPRSYPAYSAPWGGKPPVAAYTVAVQPVYEPLHVADAPLHPVRKGYEVHLEPELPPGPPLDRPALDAGSSPEPLSGSAPQQLASSQRETNADVQASAPGVFTPPQRPSSYAGMWKASVGSASCRIQLSSVPSLDLYKASAQNCSDNALKTVNGWSIRDNQVILFSRGQVVARLSGAEAALSGRLNGSEAELTMTR
ncbi:AprI/Inh family metalloprotease inhibitor [Microvirga arabica]|uniref:AprI/Inh family metalloprotease inhibitor n=1 Tax=Microvirga arabica TaxID=1128671 RepID=UPI00193A8976|nr:AprI/Inh family metalloprotease inhibitor [Microvirga arabica]MBM1169531.1 AprI/Inh family metalloprotease inhibitor [Microvirga arabica]